MSGGAREAKGGSSEEDISLRELEADGTETEKRSLVDRQEVARHIAKNTAEQLQCIKSFSWSKASTRLTGSLGTRPFTWGRERAG